MVTGYKKTENGVGKFEIKKDKAKPIGEAVQSKDFMMDSEGVLRHTEIDKESKTIVYKDVVDEKELTSISEEMEIAHQKERNVDKFINMIPDTLLAPIRASLTIALIPPLLNACGIHKNNKNKPAEDSSNKNLNLISTSNNKITSGKANNFASTFSAFKKGGV